MGAIDLESANREVTAWPIALCAWASDGAEPSTDSYVTMEKKNQLPKRRFWTLNMVDVKH